MMYVGLNVAAYYSILYFLLFPLFTMSCFNELTYVLFFRFFCPGHPSVTSHHCSVCRSVQTVRSFVHHPFVRTNETCLLELWSVTMVFVVLSNAIITLNSYSEKRAAWTPLWYKSYDQCYNLCLCVPAGLLTHFCIFWGFYVVSAKRPVPLWEVRGGGECVFCIWTLVMKETCIMCV